MLRKGLLAAGVCRVVDLGLVEYTWAWDSQKRLAAAVADDQADQHLLLVEHPHTYTIGRSGNGCHVLLDDAGLRQRGVSLHWVDRGGDVTYHGPGQIVAYPILTLRRLGYGAVDYVRALEEIIIRTLADFGIGAGRVAGRPGVWVGDDKVAAIGVRVARGVTSHGFALNVAPDLSYFEGIIPCGLAGCGVTSMARLLGRPLTVQDVKEALLFHFSRVLGLELGYGHLSLGAVEHPVGHSVGQCS